MVDSSDPCIAIVHSSDVSGVGCLQLGRPIPGQWLGLPDGNVEIEKVAALCLGYGWRMVEPRCVCRGSHRLRYHGGGGGPRRHGLGLAVLATKLERHQCQIEMP